MTQFTSPPVGWPVQFFPEGDRQSPRAGQCVSRGNRGQIRVNYHEVGGGQFVSTGRYVLHIDDPQLRERPERARREGGWAYVPGLEYVDTCTPQDPQADAPATEPKDERFLAGERKVREMSAAGKSRQEIARAVRGFGIKNADVGRILETEPAMA